MHFSSGGAIYAKNECDNLAYLSGTAPAITANTIFYNKPVFDNIEAAILARCEPNKPFFEDKPKHDRPRHSGVIG